MPSSKTCAFATGLCGLAAAYALLNVIAVADLDYNDYPGGKEIVTRWVLGLLAFALLALGCAVATWLAHRRERPAC